MTLLSKRERTRQELTKNAIMHLAAHNGEVSTVDLMQIREAVASTLMEKLFDDE